MADLNSNNSFDSNMGAGLGPAFANEMSWDALNTSAFTTINNPSSGSTRTISPKDIFQDPLDPLGSAPPSTAFTDLTSPDIGESPFLTDSYDTSPMFQGDGLTAHDNWFSLFPEDNHDNKASHHVAPALERTVSSQSMARSSSSSTNSPIVLDGSHRRKSSVNGSPATNGVQKPRRRKGPLPPIAVDPSDKIALKRARNTLAARDSRQRKFDHVQTLEKRNAELEAEVEKWKSIALAQGYNAA
ncbi:cross-pathway control protein 1 [Clohesyomyces aquaticus]|uniref:Cross-pathway control protein 1 n=1 Tax=Clohesyomyces aquaticus TaxID=1231657 RepID=A0A1Y1ZTE4_9PLEO|nr:cross-pathway control protein 1 [Clohesyomyces aquaticus]